MANKFIISDTHFGHTNSWEKFKLPNGDPLRPFTSTEEMDECMVDRWNAVVGEYDTVYHLGDVVINKKSLHHVSRLNGKKRLIRGNHDIFKDQDYYDVGFTALYGSRVFVDQFIMTHIPLHADCVTNRFRVNVHGHLHSNEVTREVPKYPQLIHIKKTEIDPRYLCVSVEHTDYTPLSFEEVEARIQARWTETGYAGSNGNGNGSGPG